MHQRPPFCDHQAVVDLTKQCMQALFNAGLKTDNWLRAPRWQRRVAGRRSGLLDNLSTRHVSRLLPWSTLLYDLNETNPDNGLTRDKLPKLGPLLRSQKISPLEGQPSEEVRRQIKALLEKPRPAVSGETLRTLRVIEVLEKIGTAQVRDVLKKLANGAAAARETREAQESLELGAQRKVTSSFNNLLLAEEDVCASPGLIWGLAPSGYSRRLSLTWTFTN